MQATLNMTYWGDTIIVIVVVVYSIAIVVNLTRSSTDVETVSLPATEPEHF